MNMIVAADKKNGIGYQGKLLVTIPFDQQLFRKETIGKVVVMGRKTLESLPGGRISHGAHVAQSVPFSMFLRI